MKIARPNVYLVVLSAYALLGFAAWATWNLRSALSLVIVSLLTMLLTALLCSDVASLTASATRGGLRVKASRAKRKRHHRPAAVASASARTTVDSDV
jgi:hypothetical protein